MVNWTDPQPRQEWIESIPPRFVIARARVNGEPQYSLVDGDERVGWYGSADEAKRAAEARA